MTFTARRVFLIVFGVYLLTWGGHLYSPDEEVMYRMVDSIVSKRTLAIEPIAGGFATRPGVDGRQYGQYGLGQPLAAIPFYLVGRAFAAALPPAHEFWKSATIDGAESYHGATDGANGSYWRRFGVALLSPTLGAALAAFVFLVALELSGERGTAGRVALLYAFATMAWPASKPFFSEPLAAFCVLGAFYFLLRARKPLGPPATLRHGMQPMGANQSAEPADAEGAWDLNYLYAGVCTGYAVLTRLDSALLCLGVGVYFLALQWRHDWRRIGANAALFGAANLFFLLVILGLNQSMYGSPLSTGYADQSEGVKFATPLHIGLYGQLFSYGKGLFWFSPAIAAALFWDRGMFARRHRMFALSLYFGALVFLLAMSKWQNWGGGWCWGPRHIQQLNALLILPALTLFDSERWRRWSARALYAVVLLVGAQVQLIGCSQSFIEFYRYCYVLPNLETSARVHYSGEVGTMYNEYLLLRPAPGVEKTDPGRALWAVDIWSRAQADPGVLTRELQPDPWIASLPGKETADDRHRRLRQGRPKPGVVPPLRQSFWVPQHTVWYGYPAMWQEYREHDFFWLWVVGVKADPPPEMEVFLN